MRPEGPEESVLPLLEAVAWQVGLPGAGHLGQELEGAGYFERTLLGQWEAVHEVLALHLAAAPEPAAVARAWAEQAGPRVAFFLPGAWTRFAHGEGLGWACAEPILRLLAADPDRGVNDAVAAFGVRPWAEELGPPLLADLADWVVPSRPEGVRRAALAATRPAGVWVRHLDWAMDLPDRLLPLWDVAARDPSPWVANALGNALNDLTRNHPERIVAWVGRWLEEEPEPPQAVRLSHKALRGLVRRGDRRALALLGLEPFPAEVEARLLGDPVVRSGRRLRFELEVVYDGPPRDVLLVCELRTPGSSPDRPRKRRFQAGFWELDGSGSHLLQATDRIFERKNAPLWSGPAEARFQLNGVEVARVPFEIAGRDPATRPGRS